MGVESRQSTNSLPYTDKQREGEGEGEKGERERQTDMELVFDETRVALQSSVRPGAGPPAGCQVPGGRTPTPACIANVASPVIPHLPSNGLLSAHPAFIVTV